MVKRKSAYLDHLARVPMFSALSKRDLEWLGRQAEELRFDEGTVLVREGQTGREFFVIVDGKAKVTRGKKDVATLGPGDFFGELSLLDKAPRNATVTAASPLAVVVLESRAFTSALAEIPEMSRKLLVGMARRLNELDSRA
jgi:CRP-like cAMP-binding protein